MTHYGLLATETRRDPQFELIMSTVRLARISLGAQAASIFLATPQGSLRLEALSGQGEEKLMGWEVPQHAGVAGWVFQSGETILVKDVATDSRFDRAAAESTGYVPDVIAAAPLSVASRDLGVLEVLDPALDRFGEAECLAMIDEVARQTTAALVMGEGGPQGNPDDLGTLRSVIAMPREERTLDLDRFLEGVDVACRQFVRGSGRRASV